MYTPYSELSATFFGFNFFKELDQSLDLIYLLVYSLESFLTNKSLNERPLFSFAGCKSTYPFSNHQIYFKKN